MADAPHDDTTAQTESRTEQQGQPDTQGDRPKRRRRRRKSSRPQEAETGASQPSAEREPAPASGAEPGRDDRGPKRRRSRGGRGRKRSGDAAPAPQQRSSRPADADDYDDDDDVISDQPRKRRARPEATVKVENWEEIFEKQTFADLGLRNSVLRGVEDAGFTHPTKIQAELIPLVIEGRDVLGQSRTGTGKTAAFGLPLYHLAQRDLPFQSLILAPTRELAIQITEELRDLGRHTPIRVSAVYGGQKIPTQAARLAEGPEIIVATPGRLWDMKQRGYLHFNNVRFVILDEVDRMLDIGFREDIKTILKSIRTEHQTVFVSATIGEEIERLARSFMKEPARLETTGSSLTVSLVEQHYISVQPWDKRRLLKHVLTHEDPDLTIVFCRMKRTVDDVTRSLTNAGIDAHAIHGDMYQGKRNSVMKLLREGELSVIVASDLAARGLDVDGISHVINYDLPDDPEVYIHRIGRTARAGRDGIAWAFVTPDQGPLLTAIEKLANIHIPEREYPDFKPGPVPRWIEEEKSKEAARTEKLQSRSRHDPPSMPAPAKVDSNRFPGGIVPTKLPPKRLQGRSRTTRSMKGMPSDDTTLPPPATD
ncbi:MAG: DEAD/DEAH box helicase [Phycisphaeraceae bacterium]|nr:MAG: DEAD/DEAH box helicase [Phycisphaeraceae bacterium]